MRRRAGFTVTELIIAAGVLLVLCGAAASTLVVALRYWTGSGDRALAERNARVAMAIISAELRQAIPDEHPTTGYPAIIPPVAPTGVLMPNANSPQSDTLTFTEPDPTGYLPDSPGWTAERADAYQLVRYYARDSAIYRETTRFTSAGDVAQVAEDLLVAAPEGSLALSCTSLGPDAVQVALTSRKGTALAVVQARVTTLGH